MSATLLAEAKAALHSLLTGTQTASVTINGRSVAYTQANIEQLKKYVRELEALYGELDADGHNPSRRGCIGTYG